jgi:uncharacterized protein DUF1579
MIRHERRPYVSILAIALMAAVGAGVTAPEAVNAAKSKAKAAAAPSEKEMEDAMMKAAQPGPQHEFLKKFAGDWKASVKSWMGPGEPQVSEGSAHSEMILGGRFLQEDFKGNFMGQPFEGHGLTGYDNPGKKFVGTWVDSMTTGVMTSAGSLDKTGKVLTASATYTDPMTGKPGKSRMVTKIVDDNNHVFEMYGMHEGKEVKEMEITYTRVK